MVKYTLKVQAHVSQAIKEGIKSMANKTGKTYYERNKKEADKKSNRKDYQQPRKVDFVEIENRPGYRPMGGGVAPGGGGAALYIASKFGVFDRKVSATRPPDQIGTNPKTKVYKDKTAPKKKKKIGKLRKLFGSKPAY